MLRFLVLFFISFSAFSTVNLKVLNGDHLSIFCKAEYINEQTLITAAHCVEGFKKEEIKIDNIKIISIFNPKLYKKNFLYNQFDFAFIKITKTKEKKYKSFSKFEIGNEVNANGKLAQITHIFETEIKVEFKRESVCLNDSGSGLFYEGKLIGILSRGDNDCKSFAYYTKVSKALDYMNDKESLKKDIMIAKRDHLVRMIKIKLKGTGSDKRDNKY